MDEGTLHPIADDFLSGMLASEPQELAEFLNPLPLKKTLRDRDTTFQSGSARPARGFGYSLKVVVVY
jgi:hypothetical protein